MITLLIYAIIFVIIGIIIWSKMKKRNQPIRRSGFGILAPILIVFIAFYFSISQLMNIPGKPFHLPAYWEMLIAGLLGTIFGVIMLSQTSYEVREDGFVYSKQNKNFKYVIIAIVVIRLALSQYFKGMDYTEFTVLTMVLALLYLCIWRIGSFIKFRALNLGLKGVQD